jgi:hypothetical protein
MGLQTLLPHPAGLFFKASYKNLQAKVLLCLYSISKYRENLRLIASLFALISARKPKKKKKAKQEFYTSYNRIFGAEKF